MTLKPNYIISEVDGALSRWHLTDILSRLPITVRVHPGHELSLDSFVDSSKDNTLIVHHHAAIISLKPPAGYRLSDGSFYGDRSMFIPSRIMDECTGGGACCSYSFNAKDLGSELDQELMLDIYKLG